MTNNRSLLALFETIDEQTHQAVKGFVYVQRDAKATGNLQCDEAMHHAAQHTYRVNGLVSLQAVGCQDAQHDFNNLLLRCSQFVISRLCRTNSSGIKAGVFSGKGAIGVCQGEDGLPGRFAHHCTTKTLSQFLRSQ